MPTKLMMIFVGFDLIFAICGGLIVGFSLMAEQNMRATPTVNNVAQNLLLDQCPLTGTTTFILKSWNAASMRLARMWLAIVTRIYGTVD